MVLTSDRLTFVEAADRAGVPEQTARKWASRGLSGPNGSWVRLRVYHVGGRVYTTAQWLDEFLTVLNPAETPAAVA